MGRIRRQHLGVWGFFQPNLVCCPPSLGRFRSGIVSTKCWVARVVLAKLGRLSSTCWALSTDGGSANDQGLSRINRIHARLKLDPASATC